MKERTRRPRSDFLFGRKKKDMKPIVMPTFTPSIASIQFWNAYFDRFEEVSLIDYITALIPILEEETGLEFTRN